MKKNIFTFLLLLVVVVSFTGVLVSCEKKAEAKFPEKPIQIVVPSSAGGSTDTTARIFIKHAKTYWPEADFVVVNKPGSGGLQGFSLIAGSPADGYTMGLIFTPQLVSHIVEKKANYTLDSFEVIGNIAYDPSIIAVKADSPIQSIEDLVTSLQNNTHSVTVNGIGSDDHIAYLLLNDLISAKDVRLVPTSGSTEQKTNLLGGHVDIAFMNLSQMIANHQSGDARIIAVLTEKRVPELPEIPTLKEKGYDVQMSATRGFVIPKDVPEEEVANQLKDLFNKVVTDPAFLEESAAANIFTQILNSDEYTQYLKKLQGDTQKTYEKTPW